MITVGVRECGSMGARDTLRLTDGAHAASLQARRQAHAHALFMFDAAAEQSSLGPGVRHDYC